MVVLSVRYGPGAIRDFFSETDIEKIKEAASLEDEGINIEGIKAILGIRRGERQ